MISINWKFFDKHPGSLCVTGFLIVMLVIATMNHFAYVDSLKAEVEAAYSVACR
jgi:hypothetical protein